MDALPNIESTNNVRSVARPRILTLLIALLMVTALAPVVPAQGGVGYLVFRDTVPIGPDLDASFHAVVPDGVSVMSARLTLFGTQGVLPFDGTLAMAGTHDHDLTNSTQHSHGVLPSAGHNHTITASGDHKHQATVYASNADTSDERMTVDLPGHTHTFNSASRIIDPYDFGPITSNDHTHTAEAHGHNALIIQGGNHSHVTDAGGDHDHVMPGSGEHLHVAQSAQGHSHSLVPGWTPVNDGERPSVVSVSVTVDDTTTDVDGTFGAVDEDWEDTIDVMGYLGPSISRFTVTSASHGMLEYVLVVEVDHSYGVVSGQGSMGPGGDLVVPLWAPPTTVRSTAYLFGGDLPMVGTLSEDGGNHTHDALAGGDHGHNTVPSTDHTHLVGAGGHEHEGYAATSTPGTTSATPFWNLPAHRHDLTWNGNLLTGLSTYNYGREQSNDHNHQVVDHEHFVNINVSGAHDHNMTTEDTHFHVDDLNGTHDHVTSMAVDHSHPILFAPTSSSTGGPRGVSVKLDGTDISGANGGPWNLSDTPVQLDIAPASWDDPVTMGLGSVSAGGVEWVVLVELSEPVIMVSAHGISGDLMAHVPVPSTVGGAKVGVMGSPYVMPIGGTTMDAGDHGHLTSSAGNHSHGTSVNGSHTHGLLDGGLHIHGLSLNDTAVQVLDANGTVDLQPHTHTAPLGSQFSSQTMVVGTTGTHSHSTVPHVHDLNWTTEANHVHVATVGGAHAHDAAVNGSHVHTMEGGEHAHGLQPGVVNDASFTSPANVSVALGSSHPTVDMAGGDGVWWDDFNVGGGHLEGTPTLVLSASSERVGTLSVVVWFLLDLEPPETSLIYAPDWVAPGESFPVIVSVSDDLDPSSVSLEIGPVVVDSMDHNATNGTIEFQCTAPGNSTEGSYDIEMTATDNVGNEGTTILATLGIDGTPPVLSATLGEPWMIDGPITWVTSSTPVNITIEDATSGPAGIEYAFSEAGPWEDFDPAEPTLFEGRSEGTLTLHYRGSDVAGNLAATSTMEVMLDDSGPVVSLDVTPSVPGSGPGTLVASPRSVVSLTADDGEGVGTLEVLYSVKGASQEPLRTYDRAFPVSSVKMGIAGTFTMTWYAEDMLGNQGSMGEVTVSIDPVAPIPSPEGDLFLPSHVTGSPLTVQGNVPGDVARFHYRMDGGSGSSVDIVPGTTFDFVVDLAEGPNTLLYALESPVGVVSEWVVGGVIVLDTKAPTVTAVDPGRGTKELRTEDLSTSVHFSEAVTVTEVTVTVNGKEVDADLEMGPHDTSAVILLAKDVAGNALVEVSITFEDMAGNGADDEWAYKTRTPGGESSTFSLGLGLLVGILIGIMLMFFITFRRKDPGAVVGETGVATTSIISPDEDMSWRDEDEEEELDDDEDEEEELDDEDEEEELDDEDEEEPDEEDEEEPDEEDEEEVTQDEEEPEPEHGGSPLPPDWEEGDVPEEEEATQEAPQEEDVSDIEDEIDRLLSDTEPGDEDPTEDLPDPDDPTVDGGPRF